MAQDSEAPTSVEFGRLYDQVSIGTPLEDALREMAARNKLPEYRFFATALALQSQTGGGLTETLENLADVVRKRVALKARGYALAAEARTSAGRAGGAADLRRRGVGGAEPRLHRRRCCRRARGRPCSAAPCCGSGSGMVVMRFMIRKSLA